jgi:hypothetical protein
MFAMGEYAMGEYNDDFIRFFTKYNYLALLLGTGLLMAGIQSSMTMYATLDSTPILKTNVVSQQDVSKTVQRYATKNPAHRFLENFLSANGGTVYSGVWNAVKKRAGYLNTLYQEKLLAPNSVVPHFGFLGNYATSAAYYGRVTSAKLGLFNNVPDNLKSLLLEKYILSGIIKSENNKSNGNFGNSTSIKQPLLNNTLRAIAESPRISIATVEQYAAYHSQYLHQGLPEIQQQIAKQLGTASIK